MTVYVSKDSGASWSWLMQVDPNAGPGAYSSLAVINTTHVGQQRVVTRVGFEQRHAHAPC